MPEVKLEVGLSACRWSKYINNEQSELEEGPPTNAFGENRLQICEKKAMEIYIEIFFLLLKK